MPAPRFSIRTLLVATAYIAVVVTAFVSGTERWADFVFSLSIAIILVATLAALCLRDSRRTFWRGFCLVAWIYSALVFGPGLAGSIRSHLVTNEILRSFHRELASIYVARDVEPGFELQRVGDNVFRTGPNKSFNIWRASWLANQRTGHSVWAILLGLAGGYLATYFSRPPAPERPSG